MKKNPNQEIKIEESKNCFNGFNSPTMFSPCQNPAGQRNDVKVVENKTEQRCGKPLAGVNSWVEWNCTQDKMDSVKQTDNRQSPTFAESVTKSTETIGKIRL